VKKKSLWICFFSAVFLLFFVGYGTRIKEQPDVMEPSFRIVCTIFPEYDWVRQILGERLGAVELTLLMKDGSDLHSYQPTMADIRKILDADLFVYVGGESDFWVKDVLANAADSGSKLKAINLMEELKERMIPEEHIEGEHSDESEEEVELDEHFWLSLAHASAVCDKLSEGLSELDPKYGDIYRRNCKSYQRKLQDLDQRFSKMVQKAPFHTLVFGDRFPFRYLIDAYGLHYYAAFSGCSAETEASFSTIVFLAGKIDELGLPAVLTIDGSDGKIAQTVARSTKSHSKEVLMLHSMQSVTWRDVEDGATYLSFMEENLDALTLALAGEE